MDSFTSHEESRFQDCEYAVWIRAPQSVGERRRDFFRQIGISLGEVEREAVDGCDGFGGVCMMRDIERVMEDSGDELSSRLSSVSSWETDDLGLRRDGDGNEESGAVLRAYGSGDELSSRRSSVSSWGTDDPGLCRDGDGNVSGGCELGMGLDRENEGGVNTRKPRTTLKRRWLGRLRSIACMTSGGMTKKEDSVGSCGSRMLRVRVRHCQRRSKELSALFSGQEIQAHEGAIRAMRFSLDGHYLASAGEDTIIRIWRVVEDERFDIPDADPTCAYFSVNHQSELGPLMVEKDKVSRRRTHDESACAVFPSKVFRILEKPVHVFQGHSGEILDLSWSKDNRLLSSSVDKTVRLWLVGVDHCLNVFQHSDYVTCIQFNPVNDDYFVTGSIDGKVRIWSIGGCKVVDWIETRDIISAVSYRPDGQAGIIGSTTGTCHLFHVSDNQFQLGARMCLTSKKKSACNRITGFQFLQQDPTKILVTTADSKVRIIDGANVIRKYKGPRNAGNPSAASFTSDGNHILSASDDSNVYMWNYSGRGESFSQSKPVRSFERFSSDASVAITWPGFNARERDGLKSDTNPLPFSSSSSLPLGEGCFLDSASKGSAATWPEDKLPVSNPTSLTSKSQYKLLKTCCQNALNSHAWGLVIVTSGWDGRIRSFHNYGLPVSL
ncbi:WD repeat-containing protein 44-like [Salvia divinorum]|uniref:WD repeat-containing protein 44-like n=1 Tax=Salvia divinorum TaxID=28513 RepID=A0ABD1ICH0_SALDI